MEYSKKDIIIKLMNQIYTQVDTIRNLKEEVEYLKKELKQWQEVENQKDLEIQ